jgi:hypothetical protein
MLPYTLPYSDMRLGLEFYRILLAFHNETNVCLWI